MKANVTLPSRIMKADGVFPGFDNYRATTLFVEIYNAVTKTPITRLRVMGDLKKSKLGDAMYWTLEDFYYITEVTEG